MKKYLLILVGLLLLAACQPVTPSKTETATATPTLMPPSLPTFSLSPTPTAYPVTPLPLPDNVQTDLQGRRISLWHAMNGSAAETLQAMLARFNTSNEWDISVYPQQFASYQDLSQAVEAAVDAGDPLPAILTALPQEVMAWDAQSLILDLQPYWLDADWGLDAADRADFFPVMLAQDTLDSRLLGLPAQRAAYGLFYNRTWAEELGFALPPQDADAFREQACAANQTFRLRDDDETNDGYGGWLVDGNPQTALGWLDAFGGSVWQDGAYTLVSDENAAALTYVKTLYDQACAWLADPQAVMPPYYDQFAARQALFISGNTSEIDMLTDYLTRVSATDQWALIPYPGPRRGAYVLDGSSFALTRSSREDQLAAWVFLRWMMQPEQQAFWAAQTGYLPARASALDSLSAYQQAHPQWAEVVSGLDAGFIQPQTASWRQGRLVLGDGFYILFYQNWSADETPALLEMMQTTIESLEE